MKKITLKELKNILNIWAVGMIGAWLGALGGADNSSKMYRRILIPGLLTSFAFGKTESLLTVTIMSMAYPLSKGYGIPGEGDEGSSLGRFYYKLFHQNHMLADIFTRGTIGLMIGLSLISIPIMDGEWIKYLLGVLAIALVNSLVSWRNFGEKKVFGKDLCVAELITWGSITLISAIIIGG